MHIYGVPPLMELADAMRILRVLGLREQAHSIRSPR